MYRQWALKGSIVPSYVWLGAHTLCVCRTMARVLVALDSVSAALCSYAAKRRWGDNGWIERARSTYGCIRASTDPMDIFAQMFGGGGGGGDFGEPMFFQEGPGGE